MNRVLIVDDEPDLVELVGYALEGAGFSTYGVHDGEDAIRAARTLRPEVVILDGMLPDVDGLDVCRALRADPTTHDARVLMLSARMAEEDRVDALAVGA